MVSVCLTLITERMLTFTGMPLYFVVVQYPEEGGNLPVSDTDASCNLCSLADQATKDLCLGPEREVI